MHYFLLIIMLIVSLSSNSSAQEQITTINNQTIYGFIIEDNAKYIKLIDENGNQITINTETISDRNHIYADIYVKNSVKYTGHLIKVADSYLEFVNNGIEFKLAKKDINYIEFNNKKMYLTNWDEIITISTNNSYLSMGATLGTPAALNLVVMYNLYNSFGIRLSGMRFNNSIEGIELNIQYVFTKSDNFDAGIFGGIGYSTIPTSTYTYDYYNENTTNEWRYYCAGVDLNYKGFFAQFSISSGKGNYYNPQFLGSIGFLHRFRD